MRFSVSLERVDPDLLPRWAVDLAPQLKHRGVQAPAETLGPVTALRELRAVALAVLAGSPLRSPEDRDSLRGDLRRALDELGPRTRSEAASPLGVLRRDLGLLPAWLNDPSGAARAVAVADATLEALASVDVCAAAWDDLRQACESDAFAGLIEQRILQLSELVEGRGADWSSTSQRIRDILFDERLVLAHLGAVDPPPDEPPPETEAAIREPAGVPLARRLKLAREQTMAEPPTGDRVAWVCFANASLHSTYLEASGVEFFGHQLWPDGIAQGWPHGTDRPEFNDAWHQLFFMSLPDEPFVLVRIRLGYGRLTGATDRARTVTADLIRAAQPHSEWRLISGAAIYVAGDDAGWFGQPLDASRRPDIGRFSPEFEPTADRLATLPSSLVTKVLSGDLATHNAVRDIEWAENLSRVTDDPQRLALSTRLIERTLPATEGEHWNSPVPRYCKDAWAETDTKGFVADAAEGAVDLLDSIMSADRSDNRWRARLIPSSSTRSFRVDLVQTIEAAAQLIQELPEGSMQRRLAAELASHAESADAWLRFLGASQRRFDILLARLVRQRNAVIHGANTVPAVIESVSAFARFLENFLTSFQLRAAGDDESLLAALERDRIRLQRVTDRLTDGEAPATALFDAPRTAVR